MMANYLSALFKAPFYVVSTHLFLDVLKCSLFLFLLLHTHLLILIIIIQMF